MRNYTVGGPEAKNAAQNNLVEGDWYKPVIDRNTLKSLMSRSNGIAARDTALWLVLLVGSGFIAYQCWGTWWSVPSFGVYGILYGSASDARWHECGHGTAFKTQWKNDVVYQIACFMMIRNPVVWRWSHSRHHTDTIIVGRDPEIITMRPPELIKLGLNFFGILDVPQSLLAMLRYAAGILNDAEKSFIPES